MRKMKSKERKKVSLEALLTCLYILSLDPGEWNYFDIVAPS